MTRRNRRERLVPKAQDALDRLKEETARELDIETGADQTARNNGAVGGQMVRKLIQLGEESLGKKD